MNCKYCESSNMYRSALSIDRFNVILNYYCNMCYTTFTLNNDKIIRIIFREANNYDKPYIILNLELDITSVYPKFGHEALIQSTPAMIDLTPWDVVATIEKFKKLLAFK